MKPIFKIGSPKLFNMEPAVRYDEMMKFRGLWTELEQSDARPKTHKNPAHLKKIICTNKLDRLTFGFITIKTIVWNQYGYHCICTTTVHLFMKQRTDACDKNQSLNMPLLLKLSISLLYPHISIEKVKNKQLLKI